MKLRRLFKERIEIRDGDQRLLAEVTAGAWFAASEGLLYAEVGTCSFGAFGGTLPDSSKSVFLLEDGGEFAAAQRAVGVVTEYVESVRLAVEKGT